MAALVPTTIRLHVRRIASRGIKPRLFHRTTGHSSMASEYAAPPAAELNKLIDRIPKGTWDTHMHVVDPRIYPLDKTARYQAPTHTLEDARSALSALGIEKMVVVQPSIYGNDNACTLDALKDLGPQHGRAVVQFDPETTSSDQLKAWHELGVRGVRVNFKSLGTKVEGTSLASSLTRYADVIRPLGWVLELYIGMEDIPVLEPVVPQLGGVKVCIDHFGHPADVSVATAQSVDVLPGFTSLLKLLDRDDVWVKCSASYRLHTDPRHPLVRSLRREILRRRPDRCVFATDWPHTRYDGLDVTPYLEAFFECCDHENVSLQQVCVDNAEELFDVKH